MRTSLYRGTGENAKQITLALDVEAKIQNLQPEIDKLDAAILRLETKSKKRRNESERNLLAALKAQRERYVKQIEELDTRSHRKIINMIRSNEIALMKQLSSEYTKEQARRTANAAREARKRAADESREARKAIADAERARKESERRIAQEARKRIKDAEKAQRDSDRAIENERRAEQKRDGRVPRILENVTLYGGAYQILNFIIQGFNDVISSGISLENTLSRVAAISGKTYYDMLPLGQVIRDVSVNFNQSTDAVGEFAVEMVKLGKTPKDVEILASSAAALAGVLGEDMSTAGEVLVTTMNQFNITTSEAARVSSELFKIIAESPLDIKSAQTALQYVGTTAAEAGLSFEQLGGIMSHLSNMGIRASIIGTSLRNVFADLTSEGEDLYTVLEEISKSGFSIEEAFDRFGKRGQTVGYILIRDWQEIKKMFETEIPTSIEKTYDTIAQTVTMSGELYRIWNKIKTTIIGGVLENTQSEAYLGLAKFEKFYNNVFSAGWNTIDISTILKVGKNMNEADRQKYIDRFASSFSDKELRTSGTDKETLVQWLMAVINSAATEQSNTRGVISVENLFKDLTSDLISQVKTGELDKNYDTIKAILDSKAALYEGLFVDYGLSVDDASKKVKVMLLESLNTVLGTTEDMTMKELVSEYKKLTAERAAIVSKGMVSGSINNETEKQIDILDARLQELKDLAKKYGIDFDNKPKKAERDYTTENYLKDLKNNEQLLESIVNIQFSNDSANNLGTSEVSSNLLSLMMSGSDYFASKGIADPTPEDIKAYEDYVIGYLNNVISSIDIEASDLLQDIGTKYSMLDEGVSYTISEIEKMLLNGNLTEEDKRILEDELTNARTRLNNLEAAYNEDVNAVVKAAEKAKNNVKEKQIGLKDIIAKLLLGDETNDAKDFDAMFKKTLEYVSRGLNEIADIYRVWSDEMFDQLNSRLEAEKETIQNRYEYEKDVMTMAAENNLVTQEEYSVRLYELEKDRIKKTNAVARQQFEAKKKQDIKNVIIDTLVRSTQAYITSFAQLGFPMGLVAGGIAAGIVQTQGHIQLNAIKKREFSPVLFEQGGVVEGNSHATGGVPFTVNGNGGYEMEGGEFIVRKSAVNNKTLPILEAINGDYKSSRYFESGGKVVNENKFQQTVIRAYISKKDLDAYERNIESDKNKKSLWN